MSMARSLKQLVVRVQDLVTGVGKDLCAEGFLDRTSLQLTLTAPSNTTFETATLRIQAEGGGGLLGLCVPTQEIQIYERDPDPSSPTYNNVTYRWFGGIISQAPAVEEGTA